MYTIYELVRTASAYPKPPRKPVKLALPPRHRAWLAAVRAGWLLILATGAACAATPPYVQLIGSVGTQAVPPATCSGTGPAPSFLATIDLGSAGAYRYSPAVVTPYFFDDEGEFNLVYNQDAALLVSPFVVAPITQTSRPFPVVPLSTWYAAIERVPEHTELALRVATYDARGVSVATSRMTWDCTTGQVLSLEHRGTAAVAAPATTPLIEFYHAALDHYFVTADSAEIELLDAETIAGWKRTGHGFNVWSAAASGANPVCRFYLPPAYGDSHFYSAAPYECQEVAARFPSFVHESPSVFFAGLPSLASGACPPATIPVYRLWNRRSDSNHRYTTDPLVKAQMLAKGYIAEGYGPDAVSMCAPP
jgi:predicted secreted protein